MSRCVCGGVHCSLFLCTVCLYLRHPQHDRGYRVTPGKVWSRRYIGDCDPAKCGSSLTDNKTIAALPSQRGSQTGQSEDYHRITQWLCVRIQRVTVTINTDCLFKGCHFASSPREVNIVCVVRSSNKDASGLFTSKDDVRILLTCHDIVVRTIHPEH